VGCVSPVVGSERRRRETDASGEGRPGGASAPVPRSSRTPWALRSLAVSAQTLAGAAREHRVVIPTRPSGSVVRSLLGPGRSSRTGSAFMDLLNTLVDKGLRRETPTREEALAVLGTSDDELLDVVAAAGKVRRHWFGRRVKLNYLVNLKSGLCPEDCSYCSQRLGSTAGILKYTWLKP